MGHSCLFQGASWHSCCNCCYWQGLYLPCSALEWPLVNTAGLLELDRSDPGARWCCLLSMPVERFSVLSLGRASAELVPSSAFEQVYCRQAASLRYIAAGCCGDVCCFRVKRFGETQNCESRSHGWRCYDPLHASRCPVQNGSWPPFGYWKVFSSFFAPSSVLSLLL